MLLALLALALIAAVLALPTIAGAWSRSEERRSARRRPHRRERRFEPHDPGRERRAEQRARELLRSCVNDEEWAMYRDLGFTPLEAAQRAKAIASEAVRNGLTELGAGAGPVDVFGLTAHAASAGRWPLA